MRWRSSRRTSRWWCWPAQRAYKLKRAVKLDYVDFSTAELRLALCEREVELNRRAVPDLYLGVRRITRESDGRLAFDGDGPLVDAVVEMVRFDQDGLFDRMAVRGGLTPALLAELAAAVARLHETAPAELAGGGADNIAGGALHQRAGAGRRRAFSAAIASTRFDQAFREALASAAPLLDRRQRLGKVRHCHGDLHLGNICLFEGRPAPFDCLEFDDAMATVDVLYDLAFLLMDLWHRGLKAGANLVLNRYLDVARRKRRAGAGAAADGDPRRRARPCQRHEGGGAGRGGPCARRCAARRGVLFPPGAGAAQARCRRGWWRSAASAAPASRRVAAAVAEAVGAPPGARVLSSDRIRKRMGGVAPTTPAAGAGLSPEVSRAVYDTLGREAEYLLALGHGVVLDATFRPARGARPHRGDGGRRRRAVHRHLAGAGAGER